MAGCGRCTCNSSTGKQVRQTVGLIISWSNGICGLRPSENPCPKNTVEICGGSHLTLTSDLHIHNMAHAAVYAHTHTLQKPFLNNSIFSIFEQLGSYNIVMCTYTNLLSNQGGIGQSQACNGFQGAGGTHICITPPPLDLLWLSTADSVPTTYSPLPITTGHPEISQVGGQHPLCRKRGRGYGSTPGRMNPDIWGVDKAV